LGYIQRFTEQISNYENKSKQVIMAPSNQQARIRNE
jgi:hypothetical protein